MCQSKDFAILSMWLITISNYLEVKVTLNIEPFWSKGLSLEKAEEEMRVMDLPLNHHSLSAIA